MAAACWAEMVTGTVLSVGGAPCLTVLVASAVLSAPLRLILLVGTERNNNNDNNLVRQKYYLWTAWQLKIFFLIGYGLIKKKSGAMRLKQNEECNLTHSGWGWGSVQSPCLAPAEVWSPVWTGSPQSPVG